MHDCDGESVASAITSALKDYALDSTLIRGQGYDGAGSMAGHQNGAADFIQKSCPKALYFHCAGHRL